MTLTAITQEICKRSFYQFFREFWDTVVQEQYIDNWHIEYLCDELQVVGERIIAREAKEYDLVINVSPGESKSTICTILFPVWLWIKDPTLRIITASYSGSISIKHSTASRDCLRSKKFLRLFGDLVEVRKDIDAKTLYANTSGGERYCTSTGSSVTGTHGHIVIIDDPLNPEQATSEVQLETANRWITKTLPTRVVDKRIAPTIMVMQRLHAKDPTSVLLEGAKVKHICLPAEDTYPIFPEELKARYTNGLMNATRTDMAVLIDMKGKLGSMSYAGQFGQQPSSPDGGIIKRAWWGRYDNSEVPAGLVWDMWIDGAYTKSASNDPTGIMVCGYHQPTNTLYVRYCEAARMEMPDLLRRVPAIAKMMGFTNKSRVYIEPKASGKSLKQMLREVGKVIPVEITGPLVNEGKEARIQVSAPRVESGSVLLSDHPSVEIVVYQNANFPRADADEFVDLMGYACEKYFGNRRQRSSTTAY